MSEALLKFLGVVIIALALGAEAEAGQRKLRPLAFNEVTISAAGRGEQARGFTRIAQKKKKNRGQNAQNLIPPSVALRRALRQSPGSKGLGVKLLNRARPVYAVKLKSGNRVHRVLIDALTGNVVGR